jgi:hypothetical protein
VEIIGGPARVIRLVSVFCLVCYRVDGLVFVWLRLMRQEALSELAESHSRLLEGILVDNGTVFLVMK